jgi:hypothetical protein
MKQESTGIIAALMLADKGLGRKMGGKASENWHHEDRPNEKPPQRRLVHIPLR